MHEHHLHQNISKEEAIALLEYMAHHNKHHTEELHDLVHSFDNEEVHQLLHDAVDEYASANEKLEKALALIKEGQ